MNPTTIWVTVLTVVQNALAALSELPADDGVREAYLGI